MVQGAAGAWASPAPEAAKNPVLGAPGAGGRSWAGCRERRHPQQFGASIEVSLDRSHHGHVRWAVGEAEDQVRSPSELGQRQVWCLASAQLSPLVLGGLCPLSGLLWGKSHLRTRPACRARGLGQQSWWRSQTPGRATFFRDRHPQPGSSDALWLWQERQTLSGEPHAGSSPAFSWPSVCSLPGSWAPWCRRAALTSSAPQARRTGLLLLFCDAQVDRAFIHLYALRAFL